MNSLWGDVRYAARLLRKSPGFTITAALVIAIGIGANSAIFSLVDAVLLRDLPYARPGELVMLWEKSPRNDHNRASPLNFVDWSEQNTTFSAMSAIFGGSRTLTSPTTAAERIPGQTVSVSFFDLLGVPPIAGRTFAASDNDPAAHVVVISEKFWKSHFGASAAAIGQTLTLDGQPTTVIGVVPASFQLIYPAEIWSPFIAKRSPEQRRMHYVQVIGRRKPGVTLEQAQANMTAIGESIAAISPDTNKGWTVNVEPLRKTLVDSDLRTTSWVLGGVAALVLLMGCANIASLLLARGIGRTREIAVRLAMGSSTGRIARQLIVESLMLASLGGAAGVGLASAILSVAPTLLPQGTLPVGFDFSLNTRVLLFAFACALFTGLLFGLAPVWQATRLSLAETLRAGGRAATSSTTLRSVLTAAEIAVAVVLASGAGLLLRTLFAMSNVDPGCHPVKVVTAQVSLPLKVYPNETQARSFYQRAEREISAIPGVRSASFGTSLPMDGWQIGQGYSVVGQAAEPDGRMRSAHYQMVTPRYFETLGIPILAGRAFTDRDTSQSPQVAIVNEQFAKLNFPNGNPLGGRISASSMNMAGPTPVEREIVGVIKQVKVDGLGEKQNNAEIYVPIAQNAWFDAPLAVAAQGDPLALMPAIREAVARVDKDVPLTRIRTMEEIAAETVAQPRFRAGLVSAFAAVALTLAAVGIFGLMAFVVSQRTREFGIRMALGARGGDVLSLVLRRALVIAGAGVAAGLAGSIGLSRFLETLLFNVQPLDPIALSSAALALGMVALTACVLPARRACRTNPAVALRDE